MDNPTRRTVDLGELLTDMRVGVANVLIALHRTKQIDLELLLPELDRLTDLTNYGENQARSAFSHSLSLDLKGPLLPRWSEA